MQLYHCFPLYYLHLEGEAGFLHSTVLGIRQSFLYGYPQFGHGLAYSAINHHGSGYCPDYLGVPFHLPGRP